MREFEILNLSEVPIVNTSDEDLEEVEELGSGLVVNPNGHYERFDEIDLEEEEEEEKEEDESELSLVLNELPESERNHIVDVMCRELEMEIANQQKIRWVVVVLVLLVVLMVRVMMMMMVLGLVMMMMARVMMVMTKKRAVKC